MSVRNFIEVTSHTVQLLLLIKWEELKNKPLRANDSEATKCS